MEAEAIIDEPVVEEADGGVQPEEVEGQAEEPGQAQESAQEGAESPSSPYTTQFSREMRAALKQWEQANPEAAKFARVIRDNHARMFALNQLEPNGIDGVREKYAILDSLTHGDLKGPDALSAMQDYLAETEQLDALVASGDPRALDAFGEEFNDGLAKLTPAILDRIRQSSPEAYSAAVLPHFVDALMRSDMLRDFNSIVDVLNTTNDPRLDDKAKLQLTIQGLGKMAAWFNAQQENAGKLKEAPGPDKQRTQFEQDRAQFEQERQQAHWDSNIKPSAVRHENSKFDELFKPYQTRLKLDQAGIDDLRSAFKARLTQLGKSDAAYMDQMKRYRGQKNPDAAAVTNFVKNGINKHAKAALESVITPRYGRFLAGKTKAQPAANAGRPAVSGPAQPNVEIRTVKPPMEEIDHRNTPIEWSTPKKDGSRMYRLYSGKVVKVVRAQ